MGIWQRWTRKTRAHLHAEGAQAHPPAREETEKQPPSAPPEEPPEGSARRGLSGWIEKRAQSVVREAYQAHAEDLEDRARRVMSSVYEGSADDLEERAVRAMRRAIEAEADRIKQAIEHGVAVKRREVRLSLLVLVVSSLVYLALYWFTSRPAAP